MAKTLKTEILLNAVDNASRPLRQVRSETALLQQQWEKAQTIFAAGLGAVGIGSLGLGISEMVGAAGKYETALNQMAKVTDLSFGKIQSDVAGLPAELGSSTELMTGYYQVMSAGITDSSKALDTLVTASKLAKASGVSQAEAIEALAKFMNGYAGEVKSATEASDLFFKIEALGITNVKALLPYMGDLAGLSKQLDVNSRELAGAMSIVTQTSGSTSEAATKLRSLFTELMKPSENLQKVLTNLGATDFKALQDRNGFVGALQAIQSQAQKTGLTVSSMFGQEALLGFVKLAVDDFSKFNEAIRGSGQAAGETEKHFALYKDSLEGLKNTTKSLFDNLETLSGNMFAPAAREGLSLLNSGLIALNGNLGAFKSVSATALAGLVALTAARKLDAGQTLGMLSADMQLHGVRRTLEDRVLSLSASERAHAAEVMAVRKASLDAASAALQEAEANAVQIQQKRALLLENEKLLASMTVRLAGTREGIRASNQLILTQTALRSNTESLVTANAAVATASANVVSATRSMSAPLLTIGRVARSAGASLLAAFGGPWGLAITAATVGITYLATRQDAGVEISERYAKASSSIEAALRKQAESAQSASEKTEALTNSQRKLEQERARKDYETTYSRIQSKLADNNDDALNLFENLTGVAAVKAKGREIVDAINSGNSQSAAQLAVEMDKLGSKSTEAAKASIELETEFQNLQKTGSVLSGQLDDTSQSAYALGNAARDTKAELATGWTIDVSQVEKGISAIEGRIRSMKAEMLGGKAFEEVMTSLPKNVPLTQVKSLFDTVKSNKLEGWQKEGQVASVFGADSAKQVSQLLNLGVVEEKTLKQHEEWQKSLRESSKKAKDHTAAINQMTRNTSSYGSEIDRVKESIETLKAELAAGKDDLLSQEDARIAREYAASIKRINDEYTKMSLEKGVGKDKAGELKDLKTQEASLKRDLELKQANQKEEERQSATAKDRYQFYKEFEEISGQYGLSLKDQNSMLDEQVKELNRLKIPEEYINDWRKLKELEASHDGMDGARRALQKYYADATDMGKQWEDFATSSMTGFEDAIVNACKTGKLSFSDLADSIIADLIRITVRSSITGPLANAIGGWIGGLGSDSSAVTANAAGSGWMQNVTNNSSWGGFQFAHGGVLSGSGISAYSNSIVSRPTVFGFDRLHAFAQGGVMGEKGTEAVMPLTRLSNGNLGVRSAGSANITINPVVTNNTGKNVDMSTSVSNDGNGQYTLDIIINQIDQGLAKRAANGKSNFASFMDKSRGLSNARALYK